MKRAVRWCLLILLILLSLVDVVVICAIIAKAIGSGGLIDDLTAIIWLSVIGVALVVAARSIDHDLRPRRRRQRAPKVRAARRPPNVKVRTVVAVLILAALGAYTPFWIGQSWTRWRTSVETQDHGLPSTLTVQRVIHAYHGTGRGGHYFTVHLQGELNPPVNGRTHTTVYIPDDSKYSDQEQIPVLVNPHNLGYAERPGIEDSSVASVVFPIVTAILCDLAMVVIIVAPFISRRRRART